MRIRSLSPTDLPSVIAIYALAKLDELANESCIPTLIPLDMDERRFATFKRSTVYVYEGAGVLGYGARDGAEITALFVHPAGRRQGVGSALLEHLIATHSGPSCLHVVASNTVAVSLYQRYGFQRQETYMASYNGQPVVAAIMRLAGGAATVPDSSSKPAPVRGAAQARR